MVLVGSVKPPAHSCRSRSPPRRGRRILVEATPPGTDTGEREIRENAFAGPNVSDDRPSHRPFSRMRRAGIPFIRRIVVAGSRRDMQINDQIGVKIFVREILDHRPERRERLALDGEGPDCPPGSRYRDRWCRKESSCRGTSLRPRGHALRDSSCSGTADNRRSKAEAAACGRSKRRTSARLSWVGARQEVIIDFSALGTERKKPDDSSPKSKLLR